MKFRRNPGFARQVASEAPMRRFLGDVAEDAVKEIDARLPYPQILGGLEVGAETRLGSDGWEGVAFVKGPGWHLHEYGTINHGARPAIRPGASAALVRRGGRLGSER